MVATKPKRKKKTKRKVVEITLEGTSSRDEVVMKPVRTAEELEAEEQLQRKMAQMRHEGGDRWLFVFNEWAETTVPKKPKAKASKKGHRSNKTRDDSANGESSDAQLLGTSPSALSTSSGPAKVYRPQEYLHSMTAIGNHGVPKPAEKDASLPIASAEASSPPSTVTPKVMVTAPQPLSPSIERTPVEPQKPEWKVRKVAHRVQMQMMVHVTSENLLEVRPPATVTDCPHYRLWDIMSMKEQQTSDGQLVVLDLLNGTSLSYAFESSEERSRFMKEVIVHRPSLERPTEVVQLVCPTCRAPVKGFSKHCTKCFAILPPTPQIARSPSPGIPRTHDDSSSIAAVMSPLTTSSVLSPVPETRTVPVVGSSATSFPTTSSSSTSSSSMVPGAFGTGPGGFGSDSKVKRDVTDTAPEIYADDLDETLSIILQSSFLRGEKFVCLLRTSYLPFGTSLLQEKSIFLLLGAENLWILKRGMVDGASNFVLVHRFPVSSIVGIVASLFMQYFRLEFAAGQEPRAIVVPVRSHARTHKLLITLSKQVNKRIAHDSHSTLVNIAGTCLVGTRTVIKLPRFDNPPLEPTLPPINCALLGFLRMKEVPKDEKGYQSPGHGFMVPRTIIITKSWLFLAIEDYARYPVPTGTPQPSTPQFKVCDQDAISNIQALEIDRDDARTVTIVFESEDHRSKKWDLVLQTPEQQTWCVKTLSGLWFLIDRYPLMIITKE